MIPSINELKNTHKNLIALLQKEISQKRFMHSVAVSELAYTLAIRFSVNVEQAWLAGIAHDYCRELSKEDMLALVDKKKILEHVGVVAIPYLDAITPDEYILYHGLIAPVALHVSYPLDKEIYKAIATHTLGGADSSVLQMILFVADTLEPSRNIWKEYDIINIITKLELKEQVLLVINRLHSIYGTTHSITHSMKESLLQV